MKYLKIFFNSTIKNGPWGGSNQFLNNIVNHLENKGVNVVFSLESDIDLIFIVRNAKYRYKEDIKPIFRYKKKNPSVKILQRINDCDKRKDTNEVDDTVFKINTIADKTIFVSNWLAQYFIKKGFEKNYDVIYNGCNQKFFFPSKNKILKTEISLVTHHWSNNWFKGFDIYNEFDRKIQELDNIKFKYIGNYFERYQPKNIEIIPPLFGEQLGDELRTCDIYLTASRWEPGPNHIVEGASCGLPILYHKDGGGINEVCSNYGIQYNDLDSLIDSIYKMIDSYELYRNKIPYHFLSSERCCEEYYSKIMEIFHDK